VGNTAEEIGKTVRETVASGWSHVWRLCVIMLFAAAAAGVLIIVMFTVRAIVADMEGGKPVGPTVQATPVLTAIKTSTGKVGTPTRTKTGRSRAR
jgi:hypothetical protein